MNIVSENNLDSSSKQRFSQEELSLLDSAKIPRHVAIMMDGNRRWAKKHQLPSMMGHWEGANVLTEIVSSAADLGIQTITVYVFSTENWGRSEEEVDALMNILEWNLVRKKEQMLREGVRLSSIGDVDRLPQKVQKALEETKKATEDCQRINLVLAVNYGGRDEIRRAISKILDLHDQKKITQSQLTEEFIGSYLDTAAFGDPELVIRPSGEFRLSNFLLWQISYAEIYITETLWPDFGPKDLLEAVLSFQSRKRRKGAC